MSVLDCVLLCISTHILDESVNLQKAFIIASEKCRVDFVSLIFDIILMYNSAQFMVLWLIFRGWISGALMIDSWCLYESLFFIVLNIEIRLGLCLVSALFG